MYYSTNYSSPIGEMLIASDGEALCGAWLFGQKHFPSSEKLTRNDNLAIFGDVKEWFDDYFNGLNPEINFKLSPQGTDFRMKVWRILCDICKSESMGDGSL